MKKQNKTPKPAAVTPAKIKQQVVTQKAPAKPKDKDAVNFINKDALIFSALAIIIFYVIRTLFPIPDYISDSKGYMLGGLTNAEIGYRPMGIAVFLQKMYRFSPTLQFVAWAQFTLYLISGLMIAHAFLRMFPFSSWAKKLLYAVCLLNLPLMVLANIIIADSLFVSLTIIWVALVIYMIKSPNWILLFSTLVLLWMTMFVRYNALIYPVLMIAAFAFTRKRIFFIVGTVSGILLTYVFYTTIQDRMEYATDTRVFSGFSGWQLASNAMKGYKASDKKGIITDNEELRDLDKKCIAYIEKRKKEQPEYINTFETDFMWSPESPFGLAQKTLQMRTGKGQFQAWTAISLTLADYGKTVIQQYPGPFIKHYLLPNAGNFIYPEVELLEKYSANITPLIPIIANAYQTPQKVENKNEYILPYLVRPFQILYTAITIVFLATLLFVALNFRKWHIARPQWAVIAFVGLYWFAKFGFEVFASPITLRYVLMTMPILTGFILTVLMVRRRALKQSESSAG